MINNFVSSLDIFKFKPYLTIDKDQNIYTLMSKFVSIAFYIFLLINIVAQSEKVF